MIPLRLRRAFANRPEYLLALSLSTPAAPSRRIRASVTIDFAETEVTASVRNPTGSRRSLQLLATKSTIFDAILIYQVISERGPGFADSVLERAREFSRRAAFRFQEFEWRPSAEVYADFLRELDVSAKDVENARVKIQEVLTFLEEQGLVIDPAFAPGLIVFAGFLPMHFSVRTPKGERIHREIKVDAPMWSLVVERGRKGERNFTDIEFKFRVINIVKSAITTIATQYLESEEQLRLAKGQPVLRRKGSPKI